jgi:hypothetical protein
VSLEEQVGIHLSDVKGHLFSVKVSPVRVVCIPCMESCYRPEFKTNREFETAAKAFTEKHGCLDRKIAENIDEIVQFYLTNKVTSWTDDKGNHWAQDAEGNTICINERFPVSQELIEDLEKNGF